MKKVTVSYKIALCVIDQISGFFWEKAIFLLAFCKMSDRHQSSEPSHGLSLKPKK